MHFHVAFALVAVPGRAVGTPPGVRVIITKGHKGNGSPHHASSVIIVWEGGTSFIIVISSNGTAKTSKPMGTLSLNNAAPNTHNDSIRWQHTQSPHTPHHTPQQGQAETEGVKDGNICKYIQSPLPTVGSAGVTV